jgi:hypothetical protein
MAVEILDGTIEPATPTSTKGKFAVFAPLRFRDRKGAQRTLDKVCTNGAVTDAVRKGGTGRFYLSSGGGQTGIHGVRLDDGTQAYAHYNNMEFIVLIGVAAGVGAFLIAIFSGEVMITPMVLGVALAGAYVFLRSIRMAGKRQYDSDKA